VQVSELQRLHELGTENAKLKQTFADLAAENATITEATQFGDRHTCFALLQHNNELALCKSALVSGNRHLREGPKFYRLVSS
jgi:hypothetical protein